MISLRRPPSPRAALIQGLLVLVLVIALIVFSEHGYKASLDGLKLFLDVVLPSLLPFFILSEVMLALGVVHFLGVLFEPIMRPVFNVPGVGSFVLSMGLAAGYPMDAVITAKFREQGLCTKIEGERLLAFTNTADPLFIFGAVAVGMFGLPELGAALALAHYLGALLVGLLFRHWGVRQEPVKTEYFKRREGVWRAATRALHEARLKDGRPLGLVLSDAIRESVATLFMIMSFIVLFSVLIQVITATGLIALVSRPLAWGLGFLGLSPNLVPSILKGIFEIDLGTAAASVAHASFIQKAAVASAIIAWSGLSVHGQVASVLTKTDISMRPYFLARAAHALFAFLLTLVFLGPLGMVSHAAAQAITRSSLQFPAIGGFVKTLTFSAAGAILTGALLVLAGLAVGIFRNLKVLATWMTR